MSVDYSLLQPYRELNIKINVLNESLVVLDEITGLTTQSSISINSDSDIRRTANITMILQNEFVGVGGVTSVVKNYYWKAGNPYWFDKFIKIQVGITDIVTQEIVWDNQGVFMVNSPSINYDTTTNELSFEAVDLMCKFTGMRNGQLQGLDYTIPYGSEITEVIKTIVQQQGFTKYIINTPPVSTTPYEINISSGGTAFDLLKELRDINVNWEMYFDVNGVFVFKQIPSGKVVVDPTTGEEGEPYPVVDDTAWDKLLVNYNLDTDFEEVKNYVEVYGKTIEPDEWLDDSTATFSGDSSGTNIVVTYYVEKLFNEWVESYINQGYTNVVLGFGINIDDTSSNPVWRQEPVVEVRIEFENGTASISFVKTQENKDFKIQYDNQYYCLNFGLEEPYTYKNQYYMGYIQPVAVAWEDNPDSPFYVGEQIYGIDTPITPNDYLVTNQPQFKNAIRLVCSGDEYDNIYTNELAIERAQYELYLYSRLHDSLSLTCVPIYWLDVNQIISFTLPNEDEPIYWLIKSISTDISVSGTQQISAMRYYPLYPST